MDDDKRYFLEDIPEFVSDESERKEFSNNFSELLNFVKDRVDVCDFLFTKGLPFSSYQILIDLAKHILRMELY